METVPDSVVSYWDTRARAGYDQQPGQNAARELWASRVEPLITQAVGPAARILDTGCGTGFLARLLAAAGHRVTGQDTSTGMLDVAAERATDEGLAITWERGPAAHPPHGPFDAIVMRNVLWTLPDPDRALLALGAALRPGGLLLITDARWGRADVDDEPTRRRFTDHYADVAEALPLAGGLDFPACAELVRSAGFGEVAEHTDLFPQPPYPSAPGFFVLTARGGDPAHALVAAEAGGGHHAHS